ncbi:hypothetical protein [Klebsiella quasipneumoniae]|uniref:hypothetical protein n=1 Tax=Klebsiella quasipneumoniae TaxID=1463165 RepID=UPI003463EF66
MTERGMIFNGEMVRALLDGRKTQTRRIMNVQPESNQFGLLHITSSTKRSDIGKYHWAESNATGNHVRSKLFSCPFGAVGDRIWVRETFQGPLFDYDLMDSYCKDPTPFEKPEFCVYKADGVPAPEFYDADDELHCCWRPSIHMPRWASRILLEITDVRVERLQSITLGDICKEVGCGLYDFRPATYGFQVWEELWKSIYGAESWNTNPWVWVIEFKRVEGGAA